MQAHRTLSLFVFIDAFGWDILQGVDFLGSELPHRRKLTSILGYSSTAIPTILTGRLPREHGHFSFYYYDPEHSPFKYLTPLSVVPDTIAMRARVRGRLSRIIKRFHGYTGYFQIYNMPFEHIGLFDYCEKRDLFQPNGINQGDSIFTALMNKGTPHHVSNWRLSEEANFQAASAAVEEGKVSWAFLYNADLDGILHLFGPGSRQSKERIAIYEKRILSLYALAKQRYDSVDLFVFSDHGMAAVTETYDLMAEIQSLKLTFGRDYAAVYDSTMARFWFMNNDARAMIFAKLRELPYGTLLDRPALKHFGADFPNDKYGEIFFLMNEGAIIVPSHMGRKPIAGMHGYHPEAPSSCAMLLSNREIPDSIGNIADIYTLMKRPLVDSP